LDAIVAVSTDAAAMPTIMTTMPISRPSVVVG
jgi:hypothetical protein